MKKNYNKKTTPNIYIFCINTIFCAINSSTHKHTHAQNEVKVYCNMNTILAYIFLSLEITRLKILKS